MSAFIFPGQGSQSVGMLEDILEANPSAAALFAEADDLLGIDLSGIVRADPEGVLGQTEITQPALLTASVALWRLWQSSGGQIPQAMAGHSLGEYSALVCAGSIDFPTAIKLVRLRGQAMQAAVGAGDGAMAAILGLDDDVVVAACEAVPGIVSAANFNSPGQVVIAGEAEAVDSAIKACTDAGAKRAMKLEVSVPSHCALMKPAAENLSQALDNIEIKAPEIPVFQNVDAQSTADPAKIRANLVAQLFQPVQWSRCVLALKASGLDQMFECGPGRVLAGLSRRIDRSITMHTLGTLESFTSALDKSTA